MEVAAGEVEIARGPVPQLGDDEFADEVLVVALLEAAGELGSVLAAVGEEHEAAPALLGGFGVFAQLADQGVDDDLADLLVAGTHATDGRSGAGPIRDREHTPS